MAILSPLFRSTWKLRFLAGLRIPLLASVRPTVVALDEARCVVRLPLGWWSKNHLGSMYFGALAIGADCAGGLLAAEAIRRRRAKVGLVFKRFQAEFLRRPEADVHFVCEEGPRIEAMVERVLAQGERLTEPLRIRAEVRRPGAEPEVVAEFVLELSLKPTEKGVL
jgi:hypothetical protein